MSSSGPQSYVRFGGALIIQSFWAPENFSGAEAFLSLVKFLLTAFKFQISDSDLGLLWKRILKATTSYSAAY